MTEFAYKEGRWEPPVAGDGDATLLGFLERQRATFAGRAPTWTRPVCGRRSECRR
jgi:hypothetical protein